MQTQQVGANSSRAAAAAQSQTQPESALLDAELMDLVGLNGVIERAVSFLMLGCTAAGKGIMYATNDQEFSAFLETDLIDHGDNLAKALIEAHAHAVGDLRAGQLRPGSFEPGSALHAAARAVCAELVKLGETVSGYLKGNGTGKQVCQAFDYVLPLVFRQEAERLHRGLMQCAQNYTGQPERRAA